MVLITRSTLFMAAVTVLVGCSDKNKIPFRDLPPLTGEQETRVQGTMNASAKVPKAVQTARAEQGLADSGHVLSAMIQKSGLGDTGFLGDWLLALAKPPSQLQNAAGDFDTDTRLMVAKMQAGACKINLVEPKGVSSTGNVFGMGGGQVGDVSASVTVSGDTCPMRLSFALNIHVDANSKSGSGSFRLDYKVVDEEFRKLSEVDEIGIGGDFKISGDGDQNNAKISMSANLDGTIHSQVEGTLKFYLKSSMNAEGNKNSAEAFGWALIGFEFPDFAVEMGVSAEQKNNSQATVKYYINGKEKSLDDLNRLVGNMGKVKLSSQ